MGIRRFAVEIQRNFDLNTARNAETVQRERNAVGGNLGYVDLSDLTLTDLEGAIAAERYMFGLADGLAPDQDLDHAYEDEVYEHVAEYGPDVGVGSAVYALYLLGCLPFSSCNGGAFGSLHGEDYPLIAFYPSEDSAPVLARLTERLNMGIDNGDEGQLILYSDDIRKMLAFAEATLEYLK